MKTTKYFVLSIFLITVLSFTVHAQVNLDSGQVAYYKFQGNANDETTNNYDGTLVGNATTNKNLGIGDNTADYLLLPSSTVSNLADFTISFEVWFNKLPPNRSHQVLNGRCSSFIQHIGISYQAKHGWATAVNGDAHSWKQVLAEKTWYHVVMRRQGTLLTLYVNGTSLGTITTLNFPLCIQSVIVGQYQDCGDLCINENNSLYGKLDDLRIYNRALSADEVAELNTLRISDQSIGESEAQLTVYPNPLSTSATISFNLQEDSHVTIDLYDLQGRKVKALFDENTSLGDHEFTLTREQLNTGIYFLHLKMNDQTMVRKIVID